MTQLPSAPIRPKRSASGMNTPGLDQAARRMLPAQQRLGGGDLAARRVDLRLVVQLAARRARCAPRRSRSMSSCSRASVVHLRREEAVARAAGALGGVHRGVGARDQLVAPRRGRGTARCRSSTRSSTSRPVDRDRACRRACDHALRAMRRRRPAWRRLRAAARTRRRRRAPRRRRCARQRCAGASPTSLSTRSPLRGRTNR